MTIHVAVAVIENDQGQILLSKRHDHLHQGGLWEFPGGKLEGSETLQQALRRELVEELGVHLLSHRPLISVVHDYGDRVVLLDAHRVTDWKGEVTGREGQPLAWVGKERLADYPMPAADLPIINAIRLPERYLIATPDSGDPGLYRERLERALSSGIRLVQFRPRGIIDTQSAKLMDVCVELCESYGAQCLLNSRLMYKEVVGAGWGIHLTSTDLSRLKERPATSGLLAASCHNQAELQQAGKLAVDFAVLSPVSVTTSHPETKPIGWKCFSQWVIKSRVPVYALGGVGDLDPAIAWRHGAQGVAGIRGLW